MQRIAPSRPDFGVLALLLAIGMVVAALAVAVLVTYHNGPAVLRLLAKRNKELGSARTRTACRLHALLVELVAGGISKQITANRAAALLESVTPSDPVQATRHALAL